MSGVTDRPFRQLIARCGGVACTISEMVASEAMIRQTRRSIQKAHRLEAFDSALPCVVQLAGTKPSSMAEAARLAVDGGADIIDINMGCPAKKIVGCAAGSALMRDISRAKDIIRAVVRAVNVPVTLKMRTGWCDATRNAPLLARIAEGEGVQMLTVHGRTRCQFYRGFSDWRFFRFVKKQVAIPVVGNGDIDTPAQALCVLQETGVDGVMVGRACYGRPWRPLQIHAFLNHDTMMPEPDMQEKQYIILNHFESMLSFYGTYTGVRMARKHLAWYSKGLVGGGDFRASINVTDDPDVVRRLVQGLFVRQPVDTQQHHLYEEEAQRREKHAG